MVKARDYVNRAGIDRWRDIAWTIVSSLFFMAALGFGAAAPGRRFRRYSALTLAIVLASGVWSGTYTSAMQANLPTPSLGVWERINTTAFMLWIVVVAVTLLRHGRDQHGRV